MALRLQGEVAIVTGGGSGIGAVTAAALAAEGAAVAILDANFAAARKQSVVIQREGGRAEAYQVDVADQHQVRAAMHTAATTLGPASILVNNAGIFVAADPLRLTDADYRRLMSVDLDGVWHCSRAVLPAMLKNGRGSIVNIASVHSFNIIKGAFPYPVAKHAVIGLTRALAIEYARNGIRVNAVCPGWIDTPMTTALAVQAGLDPSTEKAKAAEAHPPGRVGSPEDIAHAAVFLASSKESGFINGAALMVDGGQSLVYT
jgi:NAD(P)-dependent dehydrogenase (short-subunit alcohol dehydrogenase family)